MSKISIFFFLSFNISIFAEAKVEEKCIKKKETKEEKFIYIVSFCLSIALHPI